jgi:hypothetical protein
MTTRDERFLAAWDDLCEISPEDIVERWAAIAEGYPGGWVQLAVDLCAGLHDETSEPEFFTLPSGETLDITPPTWRDAVSQLVGEIRTAALSMERRHSACAASRWYGPSEVHRAVRRPPQPGLGAEREHPLPPWATDDPPLS